MPRIATKSREYWCTEGTCDKGFTGKGDLNRHVKTVHDKKKEFRCPAAGCSSRFAQRSAMKSHYNIHTGEKPHMCSIGSCRKAFSDPSSCSRHQREVHGGSQYTCCYPHCYISSKRRSNMKVHLTRKHKIKEEEMDALLDTLIIKIEAPESPPIFSLSPLTDIESDMGSPPELTIDLPMTTPSSLSPSLSPSPDQLPEELMNLPYSLDDQQHNFPYDALYPSGYSSSPYPPASHSGLRGAFSGTSNLLYNPNIGYAESYPYTSFDGYLSATFRPSQGSSPISLSPSPEPLLYATSSFGSSLCQDGENLYGYDTSFADWSQPSIFF
ncbi:hypothetical protein BC835DRAFT_62837 [Cytidiella melzeri]|nr:hypothetical protein BC835DRAFT_62837 [Cytidiella melzeri]